MKPIRVSFHAIDQFRQRFQDDRPDREIRRQIADEVRVAIAENRVLDHRPVAFRLYGQTKRQAKMHEPHHRFAESADGEAGWIIARYDDHDCVVTSLKRTVREATAA